MLSMTGFGKSRVEINNRIWTCELKSVNSKYLDCSVKLPSRYALFESFIKPYLQSLGIVRGKVDVCFRIESADASEDVPEIDPKKAEIYVSRLRAVGKQLGLEDNITLSDLVGLPELLRSEKQEEDPDQIAETLKAVLSPAVSEFLERARDEASRLREDIEKKLDHIGECTHRIESMSETNVRLFRTRFETRLRGLLESERISADDPRILAECAIYADKVAVDEEIVRLQSHIKAFRKTLTEKGAVGKTLDFTIQEMNREINTTGSKCIDADIARIVVEVKNELEKVREQIQNIA